ncbi:MAG: OB-fold nucleic acid binding domain-containing protein, partial [Chitinophagales bacterium]
TKRVSSRSLNKKAAESLAAAGAFDCFEGTHRAQYFATLPGETISAIEKTIKNATADQARANVKMQTLFGEVAHEEMRNPVLPQTEQWPALVKLKREKEVTGVYLSGHPLEDYKMEMNNFCTSTVADLENYKNQEAAIAGIITTVEHRVSKNGKPFATFSIEDFTGATELVLFGEEYLKLKHFLVEGTMLFVKGKYQLRYNSEDRYELKISSIQLLQDIRERLTKRVTLNISLNDVNDQLILKIEELFTKYKGNFPVAIQVNDKSDNFSLNFNAQKATVNLSEEFMHMVDEFPEVELKLN